jgi:hypothetical protein
MMLFNLEILNKRFHIQRSIKFDFISIIIH